MTIQQLDSIESARVFVAAAKAKAQRIGFVPTMGYLHAGHTSLVSLAKAQADVVVASIFVNPAQFNNPEDLKRYPRNVPGDLGLLAEAGVKAVYLPTPELMYQPGYQTWVEVSNVQKPWEGECRPGHFRGVATVVAMLFNIIQPNVAVFGEKDFQQLRLIEQMVLDLKFPIKIVRGPTLREADGLAMSSRNVRLGPDARVRALCLSRALFAARKAFQQGEKKAENLKSVALRELDHPEVKLEYLALVEPENLKSVELANSKCRVLIAAEIGGVRLIDNLGLGE